MGGGEKLRSWNPIKLYFHPSLLSGDPSEQLVRHFLIETGPKGVKIKGCPTEPYFGEKQDSERIPGGCWGMVKGEASRVEEKALTMTPKMSPPPTPHRKPVCPGLPAFHLSHLPALLSANS